MRILMLVARESARGPVPKLVSHLVRALQTLGCEVVTRPWGRAVEGEGIVRKMLGRARDVSAARRAVRDDTFDVVVVHTSHDWRTLPRDLAVAAAFGRTRPPIVLHLHGSQAAALGARNRRAFRRATRLLLRLVDAVLVLSSEEQRQWSAFAPATPVLVVRNPYVRAFGASPPKGVAASDKLRILYVGRLLAEKGIFELVESLPRLREQVDATLVVVGEGEEEGALRRRVAELGVEPFVDFRGYLTEGTLADAYASATVFVLPSWSEGFPTVLAEAMDAGLPIVTTRIRGAADHLREDVNALFVAPRDAPGLADALARMLGDADLRGRMSEANRRDVARFAPELVAAEYLEALQTAAAPGAGQPRPRRSVTTS
jgi:glycosyltransferase involved in cell wall biosynthesis